MVFSIYSILAIIFAGLNSKLENRSSFKLFFLVVGYESTEHAPVLFGAHSGKSTYIYFTEHALRMFGACLGLYESLLLWSSNSVKDFCKRSDKYKEPHPYSSDNAKCQFDVMRSTYPPT